MPRCGGRRFGRRYRTSETWAAETDWLSTQPLGAGAGGLIDTDLASAFDDDMPGYAMAGATSSAVAGNVMGPHS